MTNLKLPKHLHPGFSTKVKPTCPVVIDWSNPLSNKLKHCIVYQQNKSQDLVTGKLLENSGGTKWEPRGQYFDESNDYQILRDVTLNSEFSIVINPEHEDNAGTNFQYCLSFGTVLTDNSINLFLEETNDNFRAANNGVCLADINSYFPDKNGKQIGYYFDDGSVGIYSDGSLISTDIAGVMSDGTTNDLYIGARNDLNSLRYFGGWLKYVFIWDRVLSDSEFKSINENPYQIFKPAIDISYYFPAQEEVTSTRLVRLPKEVYPGYSTTKTPTCPVVIDWSNPLSRGIKFACLFSQGFNNLRTGAGAITNQFTREADRVRQTSTNILQYDRGDTGFNSELGTFALDMKGYSGNDFYARILEISGTEYQLLRQTDSEVGFNIGGSVVYFSGFDTIFGAGADTNIVTRWDEANSSRKVTVNDKTVSDATSFTVTNTSTDVYIFNRADGGRPSDAALSYLVIWDRFLSQKETDEFNAAPYQIFKPAIDITYFVPSAGGGNTNVAATTDTLVITEQAATIAHDINVSTNLDTLVITEQAATVDTSGATNVAATTDTLVITEQAATVAHDINVSTNLDTLVITEQPATITGLATNVVASVVNLTLTELSCTVQLIAANDFNFTTGVASAITNTKGASSAITNTKGASSAITSTKGIKGLIQ